jgi:hypothetical protein
MRHLWNRMTLMQYATPENDGRIPKMAPVWCAVGGVATWAAWALAVWAVSP